MSTIKISVPFIPPSGNHYRGIRVIPVKGKMMPMFYHMAAAKDWWRLIEVAANGQVCDSALYNVAFVIYFPPRSRMDIDNASKCCLDALTRAKVIRDDRYINELHAYKVKVASDAETRTDIFIRPAGQLGMFSEIPPMPSLKDW